MPRNDCMARWISALMIAGLLAIAMGCGSGGGGGAAGPSHGIVAFNNGWIGIINTDNQTVTTPLLAGELGPQGAGLFDVVMTPDGKTALVSSFGSDNVYIFDLTDPASPGTPDNITLSFFPEDIALTPNGQYAVVSDGGFSPMLAVIDVENRTLVEEMESEAIPALDNYVPMHQAVAVAADGQTVLTVDYFGGQVNVFTLNSSGHLTYADTIDISPDNTIRPVNISISPDGRTAIVAAIPSGDNTADTISKMGFPVLRITSPGVVNFVGLTASSGDFVGAQSVVFHPNGSKAYVYCDRATPDPAIDNTDDPDYPWNEVVVLNVTGAGAVSNSGASWPVRFRQTSQLFGVDTIAITPDGTQLYVTNMSVSGAAAQTQILNTGTGSVVKTIAFDNVTYPGDSESSVAYPTGIYFSRYN